MIDTCVCYGEIVSEGRMVCPKCETSDERSDVDVGEKTRDLEQRRSKCQ